MFQKSPPPSSPHPLPSTPHLISLHEANHSCPPPQLVSQEMVLHLCSPPQELSLEQVRFPACTHALWFKVILHLSSPSLLRLQEIYARPSLSPLSLYAILHLYSPLSL